MAVPDLQRYPCYRDLIKMWKISSFSWLKKCLFWGIYPLLLLGKKCANHFCRESEKENKHFKETKLWPKIHTWSDKAFKDTIVNRASPSLHEGSLEIKLIIHVKKGKLEKTKSQCQRIFCILIEKDLIIKYYSNWTTKHQNNKTTLGLKGWI